MSHPVVTFYTTEKVSTIVDVLKMEHHDGFPVVQKDDENVCRKFLCFVIYWYFTYDNNKQGSISCALITVKIQYSSILQE